MSKLKFHSCFIKIATIIFNILMPNIVPLLMTFACMYLLKKGVNALTIIVGLFIIGIAGYAVGLMA